jgi:hypothetical protein
MKFGVVCTILIALGLDVSAWAPRQAPDADATAIIRASLERNKLNDARLKDYTYTEDEELRAFDKSGAVVKTERKTSEVLNLYGRPYKRRIAKNGRALEGKDKARADEDFEREVQRRAKETPEERRKQEREGEKSRAESRRFLLEIPKAYTFRIAGQETLDGIPVWVIDAMPRPDFHSDVKRADLLKKMRGRLWIDKETLQWVRVDADLIDSITFGGFLAKLDRGARMTFLQRRASDEVWLPSRMTAHIEARLLVKHYSVVTETSWTNYRKFRVDSHIVNP